MPVCSEVVHFAGADPNGSMHAAQEKFVQATQPAQAEMAEAYPDPNSTPNFFLR